MTAVYAWKPKSQIPVDPQVAGEHLEMLRERLGGSLLPANVLSDARHNNSPLHKAFEWDDTEAGEKYRLMQASHLIRSLTVTVKVDRQAEAQPVRAFVSVNRDDSPRYTSLAHAMSDGEMRAQIVDRAWRELLAWRERYMQYQELARFCELIEREARPSVSTDA